MSGSHPDPGQRQTVVTEGGGVSEPNCALGVDLGGQSIKSAVVDREGRIRVRHQTPVDSNQTAAQIGQLILAEIRLLQEQGDRESLHPSSAGIIMPGYMDRERTRLLYAANLPTLSGSDLLADLRASLDLPVAFDADCNGAAYGEYRFGAGRGVDRLTVVTIGTGIGAGMIVDGQVVRVRHHIAGSLGHIVVNAHGAVCACGGRGCVETLASGRALEQKATEAGREEPQSRLGELLAQHGRLTGLEIAGAIAAGDPAARRVAHDCGWWLGVALASWAVIYGPRKVLIGGGVAMLGEPLLEAIRQGLREVGQPTLTRDLVVEKATLGPDAGVVGAAAMAMPAAWNPPPSWGILTGL
jgi:glucokinase